MADHDPPSEDDVLLGRAIQVTIRIGVFLLLVAWCFTIVRPFLVPVVWGIIIAVGSNRLFDALRALFGGHRGPAAVAYVILGQLVLILPALLLAGRLADGIEALAGHLADGTLQVPPPRPEIRSWPLIGGLLSSGILGPFVGPVVLALAPITTWATYRCPRPRRAPKRRPYPATRAGH